VRMFWLVCCERCADERSESRQRERIRRHVSQPARRICCHWTLSQRQSAGPVHSVNYLANSVVCFSVEYAVVDQLLCQLCCSLWPPTA